MIGRMPKIKAQNGGAGYNRDVNQMEDILVLLQVKILLCGAGSPLTREERHITGSDEQDVEVDGLRYER